MRSLFVLVLALFALPAAALAHSFDIGALSVAHPWSRVTPPTAKVGAGYLVITNAGDDDDRLLAVESDVAGRAELHEMRDVDGVMKMRPLPDGILLPAGESVALAPGGLHVMFVDLAAPLVEGERFPATLLFEKAGRLAVEFKVEPLDYAPAGEHQHSQGGGS